MTDAPRRKIEQYQQALAEARCAGNRQAEIDALYHLGDVHLGLDQLEQAQQHLQEALLLARQASEPRAIGQALASLGWIHACRGEPRAAIRHYMEALDAAEFSSDVNTQLSVLDHLIRVYEESGEPDKVQICAEHKLVVATDVSATALGDHRVTDSSRIAPGPGYDSQSDNGLEQGKINTQENGLNVSKPVEPVKELSTLSRLLGGTVFTGLGRLSSIIFSLVGVLLVTRTLPASDYGAFVILRLVVLFLGQISGFGLDAALPVFINDAEDIDTKRRTFSTVLYFRLSIIVMVSLVAIPLRSQIAELFGSTIAQELVIFIPILFLLETILGLMQSALQSFLQFNRIGISDFIAGLANLLLIVVFVLWLPFGFLGLIYARCLAMVVALVFAFASLPVQKRLEFDIPILRRLLKFGMPLQVNSVLSFIFDRIDTVLIGILLGAEGVAYYEIARKIPDSLNTGFEAYRIVYFPYVSRFYAKKQFDRLAKLLNNSNRLIAFFTLLGALVTLLFGHELVLLLFTAEYEPSVAPLVVLMIGVCFSMVGYILGTSLVAIGDTTKPPLINIAHMAANIGGNLLLVPRFGIAGAATAALLGSIVTNPLNVYFLRRREVAVNTQSYIKSMIIFAIHAAVYIILPPTSLWVRTLFFVTFIASSIFFSVITAADIRLLLDAAQPLVSRAFSAIRMR